MATDVESAKANKSLSDSLVRARLLLELLNEADAVALAVAVIGCGNDVVISPTVVTILPKLEPSAFLFSCALFSSERFLALFGSATSDAVGKCHCVCLVSA